MKVHVLIGGGLSVPDSITAVIQDTTYRNEENGYTVLRVKVGDDEKTVVGIMPELRIGENVTFLGSWTNHPVYGAQFSCTGCTVSVPQEKNDIINYLGSGMIKGIRISTATKIVNHFGEKTLQILDEHPERLLEIPGIGKKSMQQIAEQYVEQIGMRRIVLFLQKYGFSLAMITNITKRYKQNTIEIIRANPYRMVTEIEGIGFQTADKMALSMGISPQSEFRLQAALFYFLNEMAASAGHTYLPKDELTERTAIMLQVEKELVDHQLKQCLLSKKLIAFEMEECPEAICLPQYFYAETEISYRLHLLMAHTAPAVKHGLNRKIAQYEESIGIRFSELQKQAIRTAVQQGTMVITGGPGTGKTTIIRCILNLLSENGTTVLCAPTGRAAKRMSEASGAEAKTIHRLLEYDVAMGDFSINENNPLDAACVIVDEMSMVDVMLMRSLLRAIKPGMRLIMVGDANQLPSVGAGNVLGDILSSHTVPSVQLKDIYRQDESSMIVWNAHLINQGQMPVLRNQNTDFFFQRQDWQSGASAAITALMSTRLPKYLHISCDDLSEIVRTIQVLSPTKKGDCGSVSLNKVLQNALNPDEHGKGSLVHGSTEFRVGDKVIQTKNNYELSYTRVAGNSGKPGMGVFNGDVGYIEAVEPSENMLTVHFDDDRVAVYQRAQLDELSLAYCLTVHKSQGSEFPVVIIPVVGGPPMLMARNLLYTALTRAKKLVVLVGRVEIIRQMVENDHVAKRYTTLCERLKIVEHL